MKRSAILLLALFVLGQATSGVADVKIPQVGFIEAGSQQANQGFLDAFRDGMRSLGWIDDRNVIIVARWAEARNDRLLEIITELTRLKVDVLVTAASAATVAANKLASTTPVISVGASDLVALGIADSLAHPGGHVTGFTSMSVDVTAKELQLLHEIVSSLSRVAVMSNPSELGEEERWQVIRSAAEKFGIVLLRVDVASPQGIEEAFAQLRTEGCDGLLVVPSPLILANRARIVSLAADLHLPGIYPFRGFAVAGGLMSFGTDYTDLFRRAASLTDKILKGAQPADLPIEQPTKFELVINLKTAKALGLTVPQSILARADEVIE